jgi:F-type H+-transporting ATPase subunit b
MISSAYAATAPASPDAGVVFPPFDASTFVSQLFWLAIAFGALYWTMSRIALPRMTDLLEARRARIAADVARATEAQAKAQSAGEAYEKSLADARANAQGIAQKTRADLAAATDARRASLEADLAAKLAAADRSMAESKTRALGNVDQIATDAAAAIVERLIGKAPAASDVAAAVAAAKTS